MKQLIFFCLGFTQLFGWNVNCVKAAPEWMQDQIAADFSHFSIDFKNQDVATSYKAIISTLGCENAPLAHLKFKDGTCTTSAPDHWHEVFRKNLNHFENALKYLHALSPLPDFELLLCVDASCDRPVIQHLSSAPIFTISKHVHSIKSVVIPRGLFEPERSSHFDLVKKRSAALPWQQRNSSVFWRFKTFIHPDIAYHWRHTPVVELLFLAKQHPQVLDFGIPLELKRNFIYQPHKLKFANHQFFTNQANFSHHRYFFLYDSRSAPTDLEWQLFYRSPILMPTTDHYDWISSRLVAYEHYIPLDKNGKALLDTFEWCESHPEIMHSLGTQALKFAETHLSDNLTFAYFAHLMTHYVSLLY